jgi:non-specific serine/threonine protein kinase
LLRRTRLTAGLTQKALADRAGLSVHAISDLERGTRRFPYPQTVQQLARALRLSAADRAGFEAAVPHRLGSTARVLDHAGAVGNLPVAVTSLIGREREAAEVGRLLATTRLLTLTGTGGVGKSRLALEVARAAAGDYPDGAWLVELAPLADPALVPQAVARALGVAESPGRPLVETLVAALRLRQPLLLVLDNCEHLVDACARLVEALLDCPTVRVLATSREPLAIGGELTWRVPSLGVPDDQRDRPAAAVAGCAAVRLFVERAGFARPGFALTPENTAAVAEICVRLDGIPLALELAAARVAALSVEQIADRLDDRFRLLTGGRRTALRRQQTLEAALAWSHDLLTAPEHVIFRRLAVFAGGWTLEAAEAVCAEGAWHEGGREGAPGEPMSPPSRRPALSLDVLDLLPRLVDKSLVEVEEREGAARYRLLESVRQYARAQLRAVGEEATTSVCHRDWCLALAEQAAPALHGPDVGRWLARLEAEHDNLRAALEWSLTESEGAEAGLRLAGSLGWFWATRRYYSEGRGWLERLLDRTPGTTRWRVQALLATGRLAFEQGHLTTAHDRLAEGLALSQDCAEPQLVARALRELAFVSIDLDGNARARSLAEEGLALSRAIGDPGDVAATLITLGRIEQRTGAYRRARAALEEGLALARAVGDRWLIGDALGWLGQVADAQGDYPRGRAFGDEALAVAEELGAAFAAARVRWQLANAALKQGDHARAAALYAAGLAAARQRQDTFWLAWYLVKLGRQALAQGDSGRAAELLEEGLELHTSMTHKLAVAEGQCYLGLSVWRQGDAARALALLQVSLATGQTLGDPQRIVECLESLATMAAGTGRDPAGARRATRLAGAAAALREAIGAPLPPVDRPAFETVMQQARSALGEAPFAAAWTAGRALTPDEAVAEALAETDTTSAASRPPEPTAPGAIMGDAEARTAGGPAVAEAEAPPLAGLTRRELDVLRLIAAGRSNREIAADLALSVRTVERHITNLYGKIDARGRADATAFCFRHGLA